MTNFLVLVHDVFIYKFPIAETIKKKKVSKKRRRNLKGRVFHLAQNGVEARVVKNLRQSTHLSFLNLTLGE